MTSVLDSSGAAKYQSSLSQHCQLTTFLPRTLSDYIVFWSQQGNKEQTIYKRYWWKARVTNLLPWEEAMAKESKSEQNLRGRPLHCSKQAVYFTAMSAPEIRSEQFSKLRKTRKPVFASRPIQRERKESLLRAHCQLNTCPELPGAQQLSRVLLSSFPEWKLNFLSLLLPQIYKQACQIVQLQKSQQLDERR